MSAMKNQSVGKMKKISGNKWFSDGNTWNTIGILCRSSSLHRPEKAGDDEILRNADLLKIHINIAHSIL